MKASRIIAPLAAVLLGLSMATYAGGGGGDRGGGGGGGDRGGDRGSDRGSERGEKGEKAEKAEQHKGGDDAKGKAEQHKSAADKEQGKRSAADQLADRPQLADRLSKLSGMSAADLKTAAAGFKNLGQFTAAMHVSQNLGISFDKLKAEMTANGGSLGKAIKTLSPKANPDTEENKANKQAQDDLKQTS
ncbi:hypothetical protein RQP54_14065 [Curvibacter sp. APW13]|uniref:hypothetical protein n=1 Tax=Curvibacter sp. APW13 TaxID=3077236 RepID=UPI0028E010D3|nr:hypothetical protein [Curvibacter sp. APW13]MDT8991993.1 hypothetical protein [Curvibacter sp. APW13]